MSGQFHGKREKVRKCCKPKFFQSNAFGNFQAKHNNTIWLVYHAIDSGKLSAEVQQDCSTYGPVALEKLLGKFKTHQCAMDFDKSS